MWSNSFEERLAGWNQLRSTASELPLEEALLVVNNWWMQVPLVNHHLHWHDVPNWPDPWDLLADDLFCELARALGIVYTLHMIERNDVTDVSLAYCQESNDNLVLVNQGKYVLNLAHGELLNIYSQDIQISKALDAKVVTKKII